MLQNQLDTSLWQLHSKGSMAFFFVQMVSWFLVLHRLFSNLKAIPFIFSESSIKCWDYPWVVVCVIVRAVKVLLLPRDLYNKKFRRSCAQLPISSQYNATENINNNNKDFFCCSINSSESITVSETAIRRLSFNFHSSANNNKIICLQWIE